MCGSGFLSGFGVGGCTLKTFTTDRKIRPDGQERRLILYKIVALGRETLDLDHRVNAAGWQENIQTSQIERIVWEAHSEEMRNVVSLDDFIAD